MQLTKNDIKKFKTIYKKVEGKEISDEKARELATSLIQMFEVVFRPIPLKDKKELEKLSN